MLPGTRLPNPRGWLKGSQAYDCIIFQLLLLPTTLLVAYLVVLLFTSLLPTVLRTAHCPLPTAHCCPLPLPPFFLPCTSGNIYQASLWERKQKKKNKTKNTNKKQAAFAKTTHSKKQLNSVVPRLWVLFRPPQGVAFPPYDRDE